ncbi:DUF4998 domain-containing protein [Thalassobellus citreus]|uniref:DUF4998 domain-containing protein n=1 Tax=Thalassobellus citreus TaxID=3367752 RepID=UPI00378EAA23
MRRIFIYAILPLFLVSLFFSCESLEDTYSDYSGDGPIRYLSKVYNVEGIAGWEEVTLKWENKTDVARDAILIEWKDDNVTMDTIIDKNATSCVIPGLENYEYSFSISSISYEEDNTIAGSSLKTTIYERPYTYEHEELSAFTRVVVKQFKVGNENLLLFFDSWKDNLLSVEIGYYKTNETTETRLELSKEFLESKYWPNGNKYLLISEIDLTKDVNVYRTGTIESIKDNDPDFSIEFSTITLNLDVLAFNSDFQAQVQNFLNVSELDASTISEVETLEFDQDLTSLEDLLYFPNLKTVYLGKNRYLSPDYVYDFLAQSTLKEKELSLAALSVAHDVLELDVQQYNDHYFEFYEAPEWFVRLENPTLPMLDFYEVTALWSHVVTPADQVGYDSFSSSLFDGDSYSDWNPLVGDDLRVHRIEIDLGEEVDIRGFTVVQSLFADSSILPTSIKIEIAESGGQYQLVASKEEIPLGDSNGETTLIYLNKTQETQKVRRIRFYLTDKDYYGAYGISLADFMLIK